MFRLIRVIRVIRGLRIYPFNPCNPCSKSESFCLSVTGLIKKFFCFYVHYIHNVRLLPCTWVYEAVNIGVNIVNVENDACYVWFYSV